MQENLLKDKVLKQLRKLDKEAASELADTLFGDKLEKRAKWDKLFRSNDVFNSKFLMSFDD